MKLDLVMWTKNGEKCLPSVLQRIQQVIPNELIHHKILVDDHSTDDTVKIGKGFNWQVYFNPSTGISAGANYALGKVDSSFFVSVEQDVLLSKQWWPKIPEHMTDNNVAVAQGIRLSTEPTLRLLDEYKYSRLNPERPTQFGVSIDNNIFRTKVIKALGGFPSDCPTCTDTILMKKILNETQYKWVIDATVISLHIRASLRQHVKHSYELCKLCTETKYCVESKNPTLKMMKLFLTSPIRASIITYKKRCLRMLYVYPWIRYYKLKASLEKLLGRQ